MADSQQLEIIRKGVDHWNKWRDENHTGMSLNISHLYRESLRKADLREADLSGLDLSTADLREADLGGADLRLARLRLGNLSGANLPGARLRAADLSGANLTGANLSGTNLLEASLRRTNLSGTNFAGAMVGYTVFGDTDLSTAICLADCAHDGPSIIDFSTLARSGQLPLEFLRGSGLPEALITYLPAILNQPLQFYSCFISYSTRDQGFAERLHSDLQNRGVRCWFAPHDIKSGRKIHEQIDEAIRVYDRLLLILSEASMASEWVNTEIAHARQKEISRKRHVLFPISLVPYTVIRDWKCFDADTGKDSAREIKEYYIPDFSDWKNPERYQKAFEALLKDLRAESPQAWSRDKDDDSGGVTRLND